MRSSGNTRAEHPVRVSAANSCTASGPSQRVRGPVLVSSSRALAPSPDSSTISSQRRLSTSESRAPVSVSRRMAATGQGCSSRCRFSTAPRRSSSVRSRDRATGRRGFFAMLAQGSGTCSPISPHYRAAASMARSISKARLAAPGRSALAASNQAETRAWVMASSRTLPKWGISRFLM